MTLTAAGDHDAAAAEATLRVVGHGGEKRLRPGTAFWPSPAPDGSRGR